jgi:hypothetical protein
MIQIGIAIIYVDRWQVVNVRDNEEHRMSMALRALPRDLHKPTMSTGAAERKLTQPHA